MRIRQNAPYRGAADFEPASDFGFAEAGTMQFSYLIGLEPCRYGPAQSLSLLPRPGQAGTHPFLQDLAFELGEDCQ